MKRITILVRCTAQPEKHAKKLIIGGESAGMLQYAKDLAGLLDGSSPYFVHKPGANSPIGKCGVCGEPFTATVEEEDNAKSKK